MPAHHDADTNEVEEAEYKGQFKAGRRDGQGKIVWTDGSTFTGLWKNDKRHHGKMLLSNGQIYRGGFQNDRLNGNDCQLLLT